LINLLTELYNGLTNEKIITCWSFCFHFSWLRINTSKNQDIAQETIRYSTSPCFGACPIYSVEITPAGEVQFDGKQYTKVTGTQELKVDPSVYKKLQKELETYRPTTGANVKTTGCTETATDHPSSYFWWKGTDGMLHV
jgi:hypothetical protein